MQAEEDFKGEVFGLVGVTREAVEQGVDARPVGMEGGIKIRGVCLRGGFFRSTGGFHVRGEGGKLHRCFPLSGYITPEGGGFVTGISLAT